MITTREVRYLKRSDIDAEKWNRCIEASPNGLAYAYSWYLDAMCDNWDALILGDYDIVMPLPWRKKWGIRYVYTPPFIQQLGIIGNVQTAQEEDFLKALYKQIGYGSYCFNFLNSKRGTERTNFILDLSQEYSLIKQHYKTDLQKNLTKASRYHPNYLTSNNLQTAVRHFFEIYGARMQGVHPSDFQRFKKMSAHLQPEEQIVIREVQNDKKELLAIALLLKAKNRLYLLMASTLEAGRKTSANHFLLDQLIQEFAGQDLILDFEGSDLPGVCHFYKNFGAVNQPYCLHHWNHLPIPLRWIKK